MVCIGFGSYAFGDEVSQKRKVVILLGPPGSGKGTQAKLLTDKLGIPHISTGDIFRAILKENSELAENARTYMNSGRLVPDNLVNAIVFDRITRPDCSKGFMLDGFPRTIPQAEALAANLDSTAELMVINIEVPDDVVIKRISGRLSCPQCGSVFNIYFSSPKKEGICDKCGAGLIQRPDDKPEVVRERLKVYNEQTSPLIQYYQKQGVLFNVNGEQEPDAVFAKIMLLMKH